jgi:thioesterase domain-containing protein
LQQDLTKAAELALRAPIAPDDHLLSKGMNANRGLRIIRDFWLATGVELDVNAFYRHASVSDIVGAIRHGLAPEGAKLVQLRPGDMDCPLFVYAGGASCFMEVQELVNALNYRGAVFGLALTQFPDVDGRQSEIRDEVPFSMACIRAIQPKGPYRILGYSLGGVFALELARTFEREGEAIDFLGMIDTPLGDHALSWPLWLRLMRKTLARQFKARLQARRSEAAVTSADSVQAGRFMHSPPRRGHQLLLRFRNPQKSDYPFYTPQWAGGYPPLYNNAGKQLIRMKGLYHPRRYEGKVSFFVSQRGSPIDCETDDAWRAYLPKAEWIQSAGNHMSMLLGRHARSLARDISTRLTPRS